MKKKQITFFNFKIFAELIKFNLIVKLEYKIHSMTSDI